MNQAVLALPARNIAGFWLWLALLVILLFFIDPSDSNFGLSYRMGLLPMLFLTAALVFSQPLQRITARVSLLDIGVFFLVVMTFLLGLWFQIRLGLGFGDGFARLGLLAAAYFLAKMIFTDRIMAQKFEQMFHWFVIIAGLTMFSLLVLWRLGLLNTINQANQNLFHEEIFLFAALPFLPNLGHKTRAVFFVMAMLGCLLTFKNTGFLIAGLILIGMLLRGAAQQRWVGRVSWAGFLGVVLVLAVMLAFLLIFDRLPDGNIATRSITYATRFEQFLSAPVLGNFFQMRAEIDVGWGSVVSHSDLLDILAGAGVIGFLLIFVPVLALVFTPAPKGEDYLLFRLLIIGFLMLAAVNPVMMNPKLALVFWISVGYLSARLSIEKGTKP